MRAGTFENSARILSAAAQISGARSVARYARRTSCGERQTAGAEIPHTHVHAFTHARTHVRTYVRTYATFYRVSLSIVRARARYSGSEGRTFSFRACNSSTSILNASTFGSFDVRSISPLYPARCTTQTAFDSESGLEHENTYGESAVLARVVYDRPIFP